MRTFPRFALVAALAAPLTGCSGCRDTATELPAAESATAAASSSALPLGSVQPKDRAIAAPLLRGRGAGTLRPERLGSPAVPTSPASAPSP